MPFGTPLPKVWRKQPQLARRIRAEPRPHRKPRVCSTKWNQEPEANRIPDPATTCRRISYGAGSWLPGGWRFCAGRSRTPGNPAFGPAQAIQAGKRLRTSRTDCCSARAGCAAPESQNSTCRWLAAVWMNSAKTRAAAGNSTSFAQAIPTSIVGTSPATETASTRRPSSDHDR